MVEKISPYMYIHKYIHRYTVSCDHSVLLLKLNINLQKTDKYKKIFFLWKIKPHMFETETILIACAFYNTHINNK